MRTKRLTAYSFGHPRAAKNAAYLEPMSGVGPLEFSEVEGLSSLALSALVVEWFESSASTMSNAAVKTFFTYFLVSAG